MSHYDNLDALIVKAIQSSARPLYDRDVNTEARLLADLMGRDAFRVIDGRLSALKKAGRIVWQSRNEAAAKGKRGGWSVQW